MSKPFNECKHFLCIGHRGYKAYYLENTFESFHKAIENGADMIEIDVRMTQDKKIIIFHDETFDRLGNHESEVASMKWQDIKSTKLFDPVAEHGKEGSPVLLRTILNHFKKTTNYYIELKYSPNRPSEYHNELCKKTLELVEKRDLINRVLFVSFEIELLNILRSLNPKISIGWNYFEKEKQKRFEKELLNSNTVLCPREDLLDEKTVTNLKNKGFKIIPWIVNDINRMEELIRWKVNGITSDYIRVLISALKKCDLNPHF